MAKTLVNPQALFPTLRRIFNGSATEIIDELVQNSFRAGATAVKLYNTDPSIKAGDFHSFSGVTEETQLIYADNGHGLLGAKGFETLLTIAASFYQDPEVARMQAPLGLGVYSLIANAEVSRVVIISNSLKLVMETERWWSDVDYRESWESRLEPCATAESGFRVVIGCTKNFAGTFLMSCLRNKNYYNGGSSLDSYADLIEFFYNDVPIAGLGLAPSTSLVDTAEIIQTYQGNVVRIAFPRPSPPYPSHETCWFNSKYPGSIRWYGQLVGLPARHPVYVFIDVRQGTPFNMLAPSRRGVIADAQLGAFDRWLEDTCYAWVNALPREKLRLRHLAALQSFNRTRYYAEVPYVIVGPWAPYSEFPGSSDDAIPAHNYAEVQILRPDELDRPVLNGDMVVLLEDPDTGVYLEDFEASVGLSSFVTYLDAPWYRAITPMDPDSDTGLTLFWLPGPVYPENDRFCSSPGRYFIAEAEHDFEEDPEGEQARSRAFRQPGTYRWIDLPPTSPAISETEDSTFDRNMRETLFAIKDTDRIYNITDKSWVAFTPRPLEFIDYWSDILKDSDMYDDEDAETWGESITELRRSFSGTELEPHFDISDIRTAVGYHETILSIFFNYEEFKFNANATSVTVNCLSGKTRTLKIDQF